MMKRCRVNRVELVYRAEANCPLRAITHDANGKPKAEWTAFTSWQTAVFCEWTQPNALPKQIKECFRNKQGIIVLQSAILVTQPYTAVSCIITEWQLRACEGSVDRFLKRLEKNLVVDHSKQGAIQFCLAGKQDMHRIEPFTQPVTNTDAFQPASPAYNIKPKNI